MLSSLLYHVTLWRPLLNHVSLWSPLLYHVSLWSPLLYHVSLWPPLFYHVSLWLSLLYLILLWSPLLYHVSLWPPMLYHVSLWPLMFYNVSLCQPLFYHASLWAPVIPYFLTTTSVIIPYLTCTGIKLWPVQQLEMVSSCCSIDLTLSAVLYYFDVPWLSTREDILVVSPSLRGRALKFKIRCRQSQHSLD